MAEFVDLNELESNIIFDHPHSISNIKLDTKIIDGKIEDSEVDGICSNPNIIEIEKIPSKKLEEPEEEHICIKEDCDASKYYGCTTEDGGFKKDNLFSELTDEYQRTIARINLGIADEYALKWGNITGNLLNQKDLYTFVTDQIAYDLNKVIDEINLKLAQWACEIEYRLENKADIYSPNFKGEPTTTLPPITDNSNRIASTEWVNARIQASNISQNVEYIKVTPEYKYADEGPIDVTVTWKYKKEVTSQYINDIELDPTINYHIFRGVTDEFSIILRYYTEVDQGVSVVNFEVKYPIYYGTSINTSENQKTIYNYVEVDSGTSNYIYLMIPNLKDAELSVNGLIGGFTFIGTQEINDVPYYIYRSFNKGLGLTKVVINNHQNSLLLENRISTIEKQIEQLNSKSLIMLE